MSERIAGQHIPSTERFAKDIDRSGHRKQHKFVLYAPNVHVGGGIVLLRKLLSAWPLDVPLTLFLDHRARDLLILPTGVAVSWVIPSVISRFKADLKLRRDSCVDDTILCFHGLPSILPNDARMLVFLQNRLYLDSKLSERFSWKTRLRLTFERFVSNTFRHRVSEYIVQTPAMHRALLHWWSALDSGTAPAVKILPFVDALPERHGELDNSPEWDFVYVADGEAHKNHGALIAAWRLLADEGLRPTLVLTLGAKDQTLIARIIEATALSKLRISNLGHLPHRDVLELYANARAMIFPSISESFGLPLVECASLGLPILASELDFVRDVCVPVQTFDPASPVSIARAVKRFMGQPEAPLRLNTPAQFWEKILQDARPESAGVSVSS